MAQDDEDLYEPLPMSEVDENIGRIVVDRKKPAEVRTPPKRSELCSSISIRSCCAGRLWRVLLPEH